MNKLPILVVFFSLVTISLCDPYCPHISSAPVINTLTFCTDYSNISACCDPVVDAQLENNFNQAAILLGTQNCYQNMKTMFCAAYCRTTQEEYMEIDILPNNINNITIFVNDSYVLGFYESCKDRCLIFGGGTQTIADTYVPQCGEANAHICFLAFLASSNDPTFTPSPTFPYAQFADGFYPATNQTLSLPPALPGIGFDLTGCNPGGSTTTTTTTGESAKTLYSLTLVVILGLVSFVFTLM